MFNVHLESFVRLRVKGPRQLSSDSTLNRAAQHGPFSELPDEILYVILLLLAATEPYTVLQLRQASVASFREQVLTQVRRLVTTYL